MVNPTPNPSEREAIVLADWGIGTSPDLCRAVERLGWFYLLRVTCQSKICTDRGDSTIATMVQPGDVWAAEGRIFKKRGRLPARACAWLMALGCHAVQLDLASSLVRNPDSTRRRLWSLFKEALFFFANFARRYACFFHLAFFPDHRLP